jgi:DNA-binding CsgD family transcriptional regulator
VENQRVVEAIPVRLVHLLVAVLWPAAAALGLWRARALHRRKTRLRVYLLMALGFAIGANAAVMALSDRHPQGVLHMVAVVVLALMGVVVLYLVAAYGDEIAHEERVLYALSRGRLGDGHGRADPERPLSAREVEVIGLLCKGLRNEEIAQYLGISKNTVLTHLRNIMRKLHAPSRVDVVGWAIESGLFDTTSGDVDAEVAGKLLTARG